MKFFILLFFMVNAEAGTQVAPSKPVFDDEACENFQKIASEFVEMELSGLRWQGTVESPVCLQKMKPEVTQIDRIPASDPALLDPEFLVPDNRKVDFTVRRLPNDLLEVVMSYIGKKKQKDVPVKDSFVLKLNFGRARAERGCASWYSEPEHFVMRKKCWRD